jgi:hypothetical protein
LAIGYVSEPKASLARFHQSLLTSHFSRLTYG